MGRSKNEHLEGLLVQKNQQIAALETQLQAYIARTSILQSRLLSTLDTLDVIQSSQNKELDAMVQTNRRLKDKLRRYSAIVKSAELERDDMRDAVLKLVEKVELLNDSSKWPHSQIRLSNLTGGGSIFQSTSLQSSESDLLFHATTMIETLRRERDFEREAHAQTRRSAQARIDSLEAQLSRREVELETFISGVGPTVPIIQHEYPRNADQLTDEPLTSEQIISVLDATAARNKTLETEIRTLFKRLENARLAASSSSKLDRPPPLPLTGLQQRREILRSLTTAIPTHNATSQKVQPTSVPGEQTICERSRPNDVDQTLVSPDLNFLDHQAIEYLEHQIKTLGTMIDAFSEARRSITDTLRTGVHKDPSDSLETRFESVESDNHRLRLSEQGQRDELDTDLIGAQARENELLDDIQRLQSHQPIVPEEPNGVHNLLEPNDGEMSMELATPLLPTKVMLDHDVNTHVSSHAPYLDKRSIPLPPSPDNPSTSSSPALSQIILSDSNTHHALPDSVVHEMESLTQTFHPP